MSSWCCSRLGLSSGRTYGRSWGAAWGRRIPIVALLLGITPAELQSRSGIPVLLKKRDLLVLNDIDTYLDQLKERVRQHKDKVDGKA